MLIQEMLTADQYKPDLKKDLGFDLKDDLICFMRNDPDFYRKNYFPIATKFKDFINSGRSVTPRAFESMVKHAYECYNNKFQVEGLDKELTKEMCEEVCNEIHRSELNFIKDGMYDK